VSAAVQPEIFYHVLEDKRLATARGMLTFPDVTVIGATTDIGLLPEPFLNRFPLRPKLDKYTVEEMRTLAGRNARALGMEIHEGAAGLLAGASRANPRQLNQYVRNCQSLAADEISNDLAEEVVTRLNSTTLDGLTLDMQRMLTFLYTSGRRVVKGETRYQASVNTIATALGHSRDNKAVALFVEPWLIECGYVQVAQGGRILTTAGAERARQLTEE
jgi:Holliday junction resolvasome RuvABC ATP-dependent DNA helicase subunit